MKKLLIPLLAVALFGLAFNANASNMGFKLNYSMTFTAGTPNIFYISFPYFNSYTVAQDICTDFGGTVASVKSYNPATDTITTHPCGGAFNFSITEGNSYAVAINANTAAIIVGSHDDAFTRSMTFNAGLPNINWTSIPYHTTAVVAQDLCTQIGGTVASIKRYNSATATITTHPC